MTERPTCWLVFSMTQARLITLRAVCTEEELADRYIDYVKGIMEREDSEKEVTPDKETILVWKEEVYMNHLYAQDFVYQS